VKLKEARFFSGLTQAEIYHKTGVHISRISLYERGLAIPSKEQRKKLEAAIGIKLNWESS